MRHTNHFSFRDVPITLELALSSKEKLKHQVWETARREGYIHAHV